MIQETNTRSFHQDVVATDGVTLVDFWAPASGPSGVQAPILEEFAASHPRVRVMRVNAVQNPKLAEAFGVKEVPALVVFKDGRPLAGGTGVMHRYAIERLIGAAEARAERIPQA